MQKLLLLCGPENELIRLKRCCLNALAASKCWWNNFIFLCSVFACVFCVCILFSVFHFAIHLLGKSLKYKVCFCSHLHVFSNVSKICPFPKRRYEVGNCLIKLFIWIRSVCVFFSLQLLKNYLRFHPKNFICFWSICVQAHHTDSKRYPKNFLQAQKKNRN